MIRGRVRVPDAELAFQVDGPADAPALLLLPGQANSHLWWEDLRQDFAGPFRTVTFDYRGTGDSRAVVDDWTTSLFASDAVTVLHAVGAERAHVYGTSVGGRVAQMLAIEHAEVVDRLALACTSPGGSPAYERSQAVRRLMAEPDPERRRANLLALMYSPGWLATGRTSRLLGDPRMTPAATRAHLHVSDRHDASHRLHEITAPTLVLHGEDDRMSPPSNAAAIAWAVPDATARVLPGRHGFFDEYRDEVSPLVRQHLLGG